MKNNILAVLGGTATLFGLGYLIYMVLFGDVTFFHGSGAEAEYDHFNMKGIILMEVLFAVLLTIIYDKWADIKTFSAGAKAGFVIGAFIGGCTALLLFSTTSLINMNGIFFDTATYAVRFALAGGVIAYFLGKE